MLRGARSADCEEASPYVHLTPLHEERTSTRFTASTCTATATDAIITTDARLEHGIQRLQHRRLGSVDPSEQKDAAAAHRPHHRTSSPAEPHATARDAASRVVIVTVAPTAVTTTIVAVTVSVTATVTATVTVGVTDGRRAHRNEPAKHVVRSHLRCKRALLAPKAAGSRPRARGGRLAASVRPAEQHRGAGRVANVERIEQLTMLR